MDNCIFCKIVKGDIPSFKIYEDENFLAILDIAQFSEGHTIVIPKKHADYIWDVEKKDEYFEVITKIANHFRKIGYEYVDSMSWGRMVKHAHFHLIPHDGKKTDWEKSLTEIGKMQTDKTRWPSKEKGEEIAKKFKVN
ncbi:HIT domain-containing protein [Candidatus Dojkabacteria bacterium]|jgi:histidine triad (HIT) family protein|nr:HIT domain-containing protein [Candidatus Dojkabacteria bacterium]